LSEYQLHQKNNLNDTRPEDLDMLWQRALEDLRPALSKTEFETWAQGSELLDYSRGFFFIGVGNSHARQWLEVNAGETINKILEALIGSPAEVRFVVTSEYEREHTSAIRAREAPTKKSIPLFADPDDVSENDRLTIQLRFRRYWDEIVDSERVISIPRYFIEYWLPILGPNFSSAVIAFRQLRYLKNAVADTPFEVSVEEILRWLPVGRTTFFRWMQSPPDMFGWFVKKVEDDRPSFIQVDDGRISQEPKKYLVYAGTPLTPAHQDLVIELLEQYGAGKDPEETEAALNQLLQIDRRELERLMKNKKQPKKSIQHKPISVWEIVKGLLPKDLPSEKNESLAKLSEDFENLLVRPDKPHLVTWYLLRDWQSILGCSAFWLICLLRSRCFYNVETGERRDKVWVKGGYKELANHLSLKGETVSTWFGNNRKTRKGGAGVYVSQFIEEIERTRGLNEQNPRAVSVRFSVSMVDPLTDEGQAQFAEMIRMDGLSEKELIELSKEWLTTNSPAFRDSSEDNSAAFRDSGDLDMAAFRDAGIVHSTAFRDPGLHHSPAFRNSVSEDTPASRDPEGNDTTVFRDQLNDSSSKESLNLTKNKIEEITDKEITTTTLQSSDWNQLLLPIILKTHPSERQKDSVVVGVEIWDLDHLLQSNNIPNNLRQKLKDKKINPIHYVGWILYAYSEKGRGINNPGFYAATQLLSEEPVIASEEYIQLAEKGPAFIRGNIEVLWDPDKWEYDPMWLETMGRIERIALKQLGRALGV
jgi:hypothetical protein